MNTERQYTQTEVAKYCIEQDAYFTEYPEFEKLTTLLNIGVYADLNEAYNDLVAHMHGQSPILSRYKGGEYIPVAEITCPSCYGQGSWEAECCNGSGGCSCRGHAVNMGRCHTCHGRGILIKGEYNPHANSDFIMNSGACFLGSGPSTGYWAGKRSLGY